MSRLFWIVAESLRTALGHAVADLILDADPVVAVRAIRFFTEQHNAPGSDRLTAIARDHGPRLATIADPDHHAGQTLENELLIALEGRAFRRDPGGQLVDPEAHDIMRRAVLAGKNPNDVLFTFGRLELDWLATHATEIVTSSSELLDTVMWILKKLPSEERDAAYRRLANVDPRTRASLLKLVDREFHGAERERIRSQLGA